jgi:hypothetical protein
MKRGRLYTTLVGVAQPPHTQAWCMDRPIFFSFFFSLFHFYFLFFVFAIFLFLFVF